MEMIELANEISQAFNTNARKHNRIITQVVYPFARSLKTETDEEKSIKLKVLLEHEHPFTRYWGAVISLSYKVLQKKALTVLLDLVDFNFEKKSYDELSYDERQYRMSFSLLQMDAETSIVELFRTKKIGSFPGQIKNDKDYSLSNPRFAIWYYRRKVKHMKD